MRLRDAIVSVATAVSLLALPWLVVQRSPRAPVPVTHGPVEVLSWGMQQEHPAYPPDQLRETVSLVHDVVCCTGGGPLQPAEDEFVLDSGAASRCTRTAVVTGASQALAALPNVVGLQLQVYCLSRVPGGSPSKSVVILAHALLGDGSNGAAPEPSPLVPAARAQHVGPSQGTWIRVDCMEIYRAWLTGATGDAVMLESSGVASCDESQEQVILASHLHPQTDLRPYWRIQYLLPEQQQPQPAADGERLDAGRPHT